MLCCTATMLTAQSATLKGNVIDGSEDEPLMFATIQIGSTGTNTDMDGNYSIQLEPGTYTLKISYVGLETLTDEITLSAGETLTKDYRLVAGEASLLNEITVTSGKFEKPVSEVTVSMAVIKPSLVENTNSTAVDEVVEKVPGVEVIDGQANIRGGSGYSYGAGSRVLLLVDDLPILAGDAGFPSWRDVPVENIAQIEILKGAASALYGSSALNGVINIRTAFATDEPVTRVSMFNTIYMPPRDKNKQWWGGAAPFDAGASFAHRQRFNKLDLVLGGNIFYNNDVKQGIFDRKGRFNTKLRYNINEQLSIGVNTNFNIGRSRSYFFWAGQDSLAYIPASGTTTPSSVTRYNIDPYLTYFDKSGNRHKLLTRFYNVTNDNGNNQSNFSQVYYGEYQYQRRFSQLGDLGVVAGLVGQHITSEAELYGNLEYTANNGAAYLQLDKKFFDRLNVSAGVRYELFNINSPDSIVDPNFGDGRLFLNPETKTTEAKPVFRVGLNYQPFEYTFIRASWGQGYRFPTIAERYVYTTFASDDIALPLSIRPNPTLESETGWSAELGIKQGVGIGDWKGYLDVSGFYTRYNNMMEFTLQATSPVNFFFQSQNIGNTQIVGADITLVGQGKLGRFPTTVLTGYTFINPTFTDFNDEIQASGSSDDNVLKYRFRHSFKFDAETKFNKVSVGLSANYLSFMENIDTAFEIFLPDLQAYRAENDKGSLNMSARVGYEFKENSRVSLVVKNLTNAEYTIRPALLEPPLNMSLRLDYQF